MISIYRLVNGIETVCCSISEKNATYKEAIMGIWEVQIGVVTESELDIQTGDYLKYNGVNYTLNRDDEFTQKSDVEWVYDLIFEHPLYTLLDKLITNPLTGASTFQLTGKLIDFVDIVVWNTNKTVANPLGIDTGWTRGNIVDTDYKNISFSSVSCRDVLTILSTEFNVEFLLANKQINYVERIENATGLTFIQGKGNGLYEVTKQNVDKGDTITRIYPVGGNKNVPNADADEQGYLKLPELYLENTSEIKRIVEKRVVFEDIFPYFLGSITSVGGTNSAEIICNDIDFNLTDIAVGSEARVNFLTGDLMGCSFEFQWNNALKKLTLIEQKDETALADAAGNKPTVPSALKKAKAGDKFNFTGVIMPVTYVNNAIAKLRLKATDWLSFYSRKRIKFDVQIDNRWMRGKTDLKAGDLVTIKIQQKNIEVLLRIASLEKNLDTGKISATVSNYLDEKWEKKVEGALSSLQTTVQTGLAGVGNVDILQNYDARPASDNNVMSSLRSKSEFISAKEPDTAAERITFQKGAVVRDLATPDFVQDKFAGAGAAIYEDEQGNTVIEADIMTVRKTAYFSEVQINQIRFQGGIMVYSAANLEVLSVADGGSYLQLNFDTKNGQIANQFVVDDQIRCQQLSGMTMIKYYMSRVTSIGTDYIRISKTDIDGTLNAAIGDQVVQFGNRTNTARQSLIEVNVVDGGKQTFYQGVNSYNLIDKNAIEIGRVYDNSEWKTMMRMYGDLFIGDRNLSSYFKYNSTTKQMEIAAHVLFKSGETYKEVGAGIADAKSEAVQLAYNDATTKSNSAKDTAINTASTDATNKANAVYLEAKNYADAIGADKQAQIDGQIISWFRQVDALLTNSPASDWTTETLRNQHANDTYTNTSNGKCWRFQYNGSTSQWEWGVIADTATQQALTAAGTATAIANGKRTVFDSQPTTPYLAADLWLNNGDLYKCTTARSSGSFVSGDWIKAVKYTDDTTVNNLQIGGRNIIRNSSRFTNLTGWTSNGGTLTVDATVLYDGYNTLKLTNPTASGINTDIFRLKPNSKYTISAYVRANQNYSGDYDALLHMQTWTDEDSSNGHQDVGITSDNNLAANVWKKVQATFSTPNSPTLCYGVFYFYPLDASIALNIAYVKLEEGTKATDWTPSAEDVAADATAKANAAQTAAISTAAIAAQAKADLAELNAKAHADGIVTAEEQRSINDATTKANNAQTAAINAAAADATAKANAAQTAAISTAAIAINNIKVGGKNLLKDSLMVNRGVLSAGIRGNGGGVSLTVDNTVLYNGSPTLRVVGGYGFFMAHYPKLQSGVDYTVSMMIKADSAYNGNGSTPLHIQVPAGSHDYESIGAYDMAITTGWRQIWKTFKSTSSSDTDMTIYLYGYSASCNVAWIKLELGNKPTDWTENPEDDYVKKAIKGSASINGGLVLGNVMAVTDENGNVMAGMNGLAGAQYPIWSGAPNASNANFSVDKYGNLKAFSGQFGNFMIENGALVGYANNTEKVRLHTGVLPALDSLVNSNWVRCALEFNTSGVIGGVVNDFHNDLFVDTVYYTVTGYLSIPSNTNVKFHAQIIDTVSASPPDGIEISDFIQMVKVYNSGGSLVATNYLDGANVYLSAGTYLVKYTFQVSVNFIGQTSADIVVVSDSNAWMEYQGGITRLEMANDGFFMYYNATEYFYFKQGVGKFEKGFTDSPGVLATGSVASGSTHSNKWGAKKCLDATVVTKGGTGVYYVPHLGGSNYTVQLTCLADNVIARVTSKGTNTFTVTIRNMSGTLTDAAFDYTIYGAN